MAALRGHRSLYRPTAPRLREPPSKLGNPRERGRVLLTRISHPVGEGIRLAGCAGGDVTIARAPHMRHCGDYR